MNHSVTRALVAVVSTVVMLGSVAACSSTSDSNSAGSVKITLAFSAWPGWFPWEVAAEKGLFAANGVDVQLKYFDNYTDSLTALSTGAVTANSQTLKERSSRWRPEPSRPSCWSTTTPPATTRSSPGRASTAWPI